MKITGLFPALAIRNYRNFWIMQWIALIGFWIQLTAQQWLVYELTDSAVHLGLLSAMQFTPSLLFPSLSGSGSTGTARENPHGHAVLLYSPGARAGRTALDGPCPLRLAPLFAFLLGSIDAVDMPARMAFMPLLVGRAQLHSAVALNSANFNITRMFGPLLAAFLLAHIDYGSVFS